MSESSVASATAAPAEPQLQDPRRPVLRARAPLRISFAGGGTDVAPFPQREGGAVLSATMSQYCFTTLRPRLDGQITVQSLDYGTAVGFHVDDEVELEGQLALPRAAIDRVRGVEGLRVVDASVFPDIPGFFIASAVYLVSEKASDVLLAEHPVEA